MTDEIDLRLKFPEMDPVEKLPALGTIAGIGLRLYGARDHDDETSSYVTTRWVWAVLLPLFALGAYRVVRTAQGLILLGRVRLSTAAKLWNALVISAILAGAGSYVWRTYTRSPEYIARTKLTEGRRLAEQGNLPEAARRYCEVAVGESGQVLAAQEALQQMLDGPVRETSLAESAKVFQVLADFGRDHPGKWGTLNVPQHALDLVQARSQQDLRGAALVLEQAALLGGSVEALTAARREILERLVAEEPNDPQAASDLAVIYEQQDQVARCEALLAPHVERLGKSEGARILGQIYTRQGKWDEGHALLLVYAQDRLEDLQEAEKTYTETLKHAQELVAAELESGKADPDIYRRAENASEARRRELIQEYFQQRLQQNADVTKAEAVLIQKARVVPVALDLGIAMLHRTESLDDADARRQALEKAEQVFLAIRGFASETTEYRLSLAQVNYWLGKPKEGRELFDQVLEEKGRSYEILVAVGTLLRDLGSDPECRALVEEAYNKASHDQEKQAAARFRSICALDLDDSITWLRRADPSDPETQAQLNERLGRQALQTGNADAARNYFQLSIDLYGRLPETTATLNNAGLVYLAQFTATGDASNLNRGSELIQRAVALEPNNALLIMNAADCVYEASLREIIGDTIDLQALRMPGSVTLLGFLCSDDTERAGYVQRVQQHRGVQAALQLCDRGVVVSPKRREAYLACAGIYEYLHDANQLQNLLRRAREAEPDCREEVRKQQEFFSGKDDERRKQILLSRQQELREVLKRQSDGERGRYTFAVAAASVVGLAMQMDALGLPVDADELTLLGEQAYEAAPSASTQATLAAALCLRASKRLAKQMPHYAQQVDTSLRALGHTSLLALAMSQDAELRARALQDADVQRLMGLLVEGVDRFPDECGPWDWAMLRYASEEASQAVARLVRQNQAAEAARQLTSYLSPLAAESALSCIWSCELGDRQDEAQQILQRSREQGIPWPAETNE